jgi:hypothetical protein
VRSAAQGRLVTPGRRTRSSAARPAPSSTLPANQSHDSPHDQAEHREDRDPGDEESDRDDDAVQCRHEAVPAGGEAVAEAGRVGLDRLDGLSERDRECRHRDLVVVVLQLLLVRLEGGLAFGERRLGRDEVGDTAGLRHELGQAIDGGLRRRDARLQVQGHLRDVLTVDGGGRDLAEAGELVDERLQSLRRHTHGDPRAVRRVRVGHRGVVDHARHRVDGQHLARAADAHRLDVPVARDRRVRDHGGRCGDVVDQNGG